MPLSKSGAKKKEALKGDLVVGSQLKKLKVAITLVVSVVNIFAGYV
jgi:hypothetical protein